MCHWREQIETSILVLFSTSFDRILKAKSQQQNHSFFVISIKIFPFMIHSVWMWTQFHNNYMLLISLFKSYNSIVFLI